MMRGRKPGSKKVHDLAAGTFKLVAGGAGTSTPALVQKAPSWITDRLARQEWSRLLPELVRRKQYLALFETELGRYCVAFGQYVAALKGMKAEGGAVVLSSKSVPMLSQHWVVANRAHETMLRLAADLGLNPVAQVRIEGHQFDLFDAPLKPASPTGTTPPSPAGFGQFRRA